MENNACSLSDRTKTIGRLSTFVVIAADGVATTVAADVVMCLFTYVIKKLLIIKLI